VSIFDTITGALNTATEKFAVFIGGQDLDKNRTSPKSVVFDYFRSYTGTDRMVAASVEQDGTLTTTSFADPTDAEIWFQAQQTDPTQLYAATYDRQTGQSQEAGTPQTEVIEVTSSIPKPIVALTPKSKRWLWLALIGGGFGVWWLYKRSNKRQQHPPQPF
jgi:LPS O-antigen subunit length determinant protein (WzzB/FepE family)